MHFIYNIDGPSGPFMAPFTSKMEFMSYMSHKCLITVQDGRPAEWKKGIVPFVSNMAHFLPANI